MTGKIQEVRGNNRTFCKILGEDGQRYHAHWTDFSDPKTMVEGQEVSFHVKLAPGLPGKDHPVTDVIPALKKVS